jgi:hypothetical protein
VANGEGLAADRSKRDVGERRGQEAVGPLLGEAPGVLEPPEAMVAS